MKLLLTSAGISNKSIYNALVDLLQKPIAESSALFIPTAIYGVANGHDIIRKVICGTLGDPFCELGWKSLGLLELTSLPALKREFWIDTVLKTDTLLVGGGDCQYLTHWMQQSGLAELLPTLLEKIVYVGLSAGSMIMTSYGTTFGNHSLPAGTAKSLGMLDFAIHPHLDHEWFPENALPELEKLASTLSVPSYLIDDQSAVMVTSDGIEVISEGNWRLITKSDWAEIFPNPAEASATFQVSNGLLKTTAGLYDMTGRHIQDLLIIDNQQQLNTKALANGMYILKFADGTALRFVKN